MLKKHKYINIIPLAYLAVPSTCTAGFSDTSPTP